MESVRRAWHWTGPTHSSADLPRSTKHFRFPVGLAGETGHHAPPVDARRSASGGAIVYRRHPLGSSQPRPFRLGCDPPVGRRQAFKPARQFPPPPPLGIAGRLPTEGASVPRLVAPGNGLQSRRHNWEDQGGALTPQAGRDLGSSAPWNLVGCLLPCSVHDWLGA